MVNVELTTLPRHSAGLTCTPLLGFSADGYCWLAGKDCVGPSHRNRTPNAVIFGVFY